MTESLPVVLFNDELVTLALQSPPTRMWPPFQTSLLITLRHSHYFTWNSREDGVETNDRFN